ncbi:hypothetical protein STEG23_001538 [Scotinomys teguina]
MVGLIIVLTFGPWALSRFTRFIKEQLSADSSRRIQVHYHRLELESQGYDPGPPDQASVPEQRCTCAWEVTGMVALDCDLLKRDRAPGTPGEQQALRSVSNFNEKGGDVRAPKAFFRPSRKSTLNKDCDTVDSKCTLSLSRKCAKASECPCHILSQWKGKERNEKEFDELNRNRGELYQTHLLVIQLFIRPSRKTFGPFDRAVGHTQEHCASFDKDRESLKKCDRESLECFMKTFMVDSGRCLEDHNADSNVNSKKIVQWVKCLLWKYKDLNSDS